MRKRVLSFLTHSIFANSLYPILASGVVSGFGFFFWLFVARLYPDSEVGLAGTLLAVMTLLATLSLIGYDTATIRFLAHEPKKNTYITTGFFVIGTFAILLSSGFILLSPLFSPLLAHLLSTPLTALLFVVFSLLTALNIYTDGIFLAHRKTQYTLAVDTLISVTKVTLPFFFIPFGAFGIFTASALSQAVGFFVSVYALTRSFGYRPTLRIDMRILKRTWRYSAGNYIADILGFLPYAILPILITNTLGPEQSAYYYVIVMITGLLYTIPHSTMNALFAESSHDEHSFVRDTVRACVVTTVLLVPAMIVLLAGGGLILSFFGEGYVLYGLPFLHIMTLGAIVATLSALYGTLFRLAQDPTALIVRNAVFALGTAGFVYALLPYQLLGVGMASVLAIALSVFVSHVLLITRGKHYTLPGILALVHRLSVVRLGKGLCLAVKERYVWPCKTTLVSKLAYLSMRRKHADLPTILFYPERPKTYHILYRICHELGWRITNNPNEKADILIRFKDTTAWKGDDTLHALKTTRPVLNARCYDISKVHVDEVHHAVFGYSTRLDPTTHKGLCVRKSNTNAVHDGRVLTCPHEPEEGYIYQKLIDASTHDGRVMDIRISIFCGTIGLVMKRYKRKEDMFDVTIAEEMVETDSILSKAEQEHILAFCTAMGLDYGELDALRDNNDGLIYIVDVNNTPAGPIGPIYAEKSEFSFWLERMKTMTNAHFRAWTQQNTVQSKNV
jgi:O-antigen/teichoic acid export membrane protein